MPPQLENNDSIISNNSNGDTIVMCSDEQFGENKTRRVIHISSHGESMDDYDQSDATTAAVAEEFDAKVQMQAVNEVEIEDGNDSDNDKKKENHEIQLTWEPSVEMKIRKRVLQRQASKKSTDPNPVKPYMVAIVGIPGSGKSTSTNFLTENLDEDLGCLLMPLDGYHHSKEALQKFPDPTDAIYRRGAPDTFDVEGMVRDLERIKNGQEPFVDIPDFDHGTADPCPGAMRFDREKHAVVICEGLYVLHDANGWERLSAESINQGASSASSKSGSIFDLTIFANADVDECVQRLKNRNKCIPGYTPEELEVRCDTVDRANALTVMKSQTRANVVVDSLTARTKLQHGLSSSSQ